MRTAVAMRHRSLLSSPGTPWANALMLAGVGFLACAPSPALDPEKVDRALSSLAATLAQGGGELQVRRRGQAFWEGAPIGTIFASGDWVRTGGKGFARVEYVQGGRLLLDEDAVVVIELTAPAVEGEPAAERVVAVESGSVGGVLSERGKSLTIRATQKQSARLTQVGQVPVEYRLSRKKNGTEVAVRSGEATLEVSGARQLLKSGQVAQISDEKPATIEELIAAPTAATPSDGARLTFQPEQPISLAWSNAPGAEGYRVQVAGDAAFRELLWKQETSAPRANWTPPNPGTYYWRLAARSTNERWSLFSKPFSFTLDPPPLEDRLLSPRDGATFEQLEAPVSVVFEWQPVPGAAGYRLLVGRRVQLEQDPVVDQALTATRFEVPELSPGDYHWGAYAVGVEPSALFPAPRKVSVRKVTKPGIRVPGNIRKWGE